MMGSPKSNACDFGTSWELRKVDAFLFLEEEVSRSPRHLLFSVFLMVVPAGFDGPWLGEGQTLGFPAFQLVPGW